MPVSLKKVRFAVSVSGLAAMVLLTGGCGGSSSNSNDPGTAKPDFTVTAEEWAAEYQKDRTAAETKYEGKVMEVSGPLRGFGPNMAPPDKPGGLGRILPCLVLGAQPPASGVTCFSASPLYGRVAPPGKIKVRGRFNSSSFSDWPVLVDTVLVDAPSGSIPTVDAEGLTREFKADAAALDRKYAGGPFLIVKGEVVDAKDSGAFVFQGINAFTARLKGDGDTLLRCSGAEDERLVKGLVPGAKVQMLGKYGGKDGSSDGLFFHDCAIVPAAEAGR